METIYQGLPRRTVFCHVQGEPREINVSTDIVNQIIKPIIESVDFSDDDDGLIEKLTKWDEKISYYVPNGVFAFPNDKEVVEFIHKLIDNEVTNP